MNFLVIKSTSLNTIINMFIHNMISEEARLAKSNFL